MSKKYFLTYSGLIYIIKKISSRGVYSYIRWRMWLEEEWSNTQKKLFLWSFTISEEASELSEIQEKEKKKNVTVRL